MTVYFISGQAADQTLFENLILPSYINVRHVHWIEPLKKESLTNYCKRLLQQIDTSSDFVLVGVSLGGIVSVELNKFIQPQKTIIISSVATKFELRPLLKMVRLLRIHKIIPGGFYKWYSPILNWYFGTETEREKELLKLYTRSATRNYMKWAVNEIMNWRNETRPENLFHIHGTKDRIFPARYSHANVLIKDGTHFMVHNRANEISQILAERLNGIS